MQLPYFPVFLLIAIVVASCGSPAQPKPEPFPPIEPSLEAVRKRGEYLVTTMLCHDCHSPKIMTEHGPVPDPDRLLSGHPANEKNPPLDPNANPGWIYFSPGLTSAVGPWGTSFSGNLTSDATGIGNWSEEQFKRAITKGLYKGLEGSRPLLPPMPWEMFKNLNDEDIHAIYTYLQSTKPVENVVPAPISPADMIAEKQTN